MVTQEQIVSWLQEHAPEIAALVEKDMTAGDVHVPADVGRKKKRRPGTLDARLASSYKRRDDDENFTVEMQIAKVDDEHQQIFGWASVCSVNGKDVIDKQGDIIPVAEIEKAAYEFVQFSRDMGDMHQRLGTGRMIESMVFNEDKAKCGVTAKDENGDTICGWWVGFHVVDPASWAAFKAGERPELSIGGKATWEDA